MARWARCAVSMLQLEAVVWVHLVLRIYWGPRHTSCKGCELRLSAGTRTFVSCARWSRCAGGNESRASCHVTQHIHKFGQLGSSTCCAVPRGLQPLTGTLCRCSWSRQHGRTCPAMGLDPV